MRKSEQLTPQRIQAEYEKAVSYNSSCNGGNLYDRVRQNERFFVGNQWEGVNAPNLDKPVFNILKRVITFFVASLVSDDISAELSIPGNEDEQLKAKLKMLGEQIDSVIEGAKIKSLNRECIRDAAVDGDTCLYLHFDPEKDIGQDARGEIEAEVLSNTDVLFGNPALHEAQKQPFIIVQMRKLPEDAIREGEFHRQSAENLQQIRPDDDPNSLNTESDDGKVTVLTRFWKENGTVWFCRTSCGVWIVPPTDTGYKRYPLAWMPWERIKNSYHGQAAVTGLIPNQIFINKLYAMAMQYAKLTAFPKIIYNSTLFPDGFNNRPGEAVGAIGEPSFAAKPLESANMSPQVMQLIDNTIEKTRDTMGASDASLGNVKPDNTSAIIAVQKSSAMPLELQRMAFYQFVEDYIRVMLDMMRVNYGTRLVQMDMTGPDGQTSGVTVPFDFAELEQLHWKLNVNIGASTYWSELMQIQTLDNLYAQHVLTDREAYLEAMPDKYIPNKAEILETIREEKAMQEQMQQAEMMGGGENGMPQMPDGIPDIPGL